MIWLHWFYFFFKKKSKKSKWYIKPFDEHYSKHFSSKLVQSEWFAKIEIDYLKIFIKYKIWNWTGIYLEIWETQNDFWNT